MLSVGHADNEMAYTQGRETLVCVQHNITDGDLGWAVGSQEAYATATSTRSRTASATGAESTVKKNGVARASVGIPVGVAAAAFLIGILL